MSSVGVVLFRPETLMRGDPGAGATLVSEAPAALAALRFLGVRTILRADAAQRDFFERTGLAAFADAVSGAAVPPAPDLLVVGAEAAPLLAAIRAGARAVWLGAGDPPPGAHRASDLSGVVALVRSEFARPSRAGFDRTTRNLVADLRGLPRESGAAEERRFSGTAGLADLLLRAADADPGAVKALRELAGNAVRIEDRAEDARDRILDAWPAIVPKALRTSCFPVELTKDALVVLCTSAVARNELRFAERMVLDAVRALPGCFGVNRIVYRV